jgi:ketosteroid isomerase-like protein
MQDNTTIIQKMYEAYGKGNVPGILANVAEDALWSSEAVDVLRWGGTRRGHQEILGFFQGLSEQLTDPALSMPSLWRMAK